MVTVATATQRVTWEKLPEDYLLPDDPVDHIDQPALAVSLIESLGIAGKLNKQTFRQVITASVPPLMARLP